MQKIFTVLLAVLVTLSFTTMVFAAQPVKGLETKLHRGTKNVVLGWTEIPKNIVDTSKKSGGLVGITVGTVKGIFQAVARTVSGVVDVVTFPIGNYDKPAVKPSMVPGAASGATAGAAPVAASMGPTK